MTPTCQWFFAIKEGQTSCVFLTGIQHYRDITPLWTNQRQSTIYVRPDFGCVKHEERKME